MSGILFIVCIPLSDREDMLRDDKYEIAQCNRVCKPIIENVNGDEHTNGNQNMGTVLLIENMHPIKHNGQTEIYQGKSAIQSSGSFKNVCNGDSAKIDAEEINPRKSWDDTLVNDKNEKDNVSNELNIPTDSSMESVLINIFQKLNIENITWQKNNKSLTATFTIPCGMLHQQVLQFFEDWGIGERFGTSVSMVPCSVILPAKVIQNDEDNVYEKGLTAKDQGLWDGFMNTINARMNIATIVEKLRQNATLTFDFVTLIVIAGIMAAFGLIEDSIICLTSSMLISPLMGPLIAATFSTVIKDKQLMKFGVINELIGISLATFVGFVFGLVVGSIDERYGVGDGLGEEILSRCEIHALIIGIFTAIPSGAALAIAILGENTASLVGVAISASLLPPAVNAGLLWALALLFTIHEDDTNIYNSVIKSTTYSEHQATELAILGSISMALTIINVICIYVIGILFLKIKEVAPMASKSQRQFWKHDVKVARDYNQTIVTGEGLLFQEKLFKDFAQFQNNEVTNLTSDRIRRLERMSSQSTWSPMMNGTTTKRMSIQEFEKVYYNLSHTISDKSCPLRKLSRFELLSKSSSPPKYAPFTNDLLIPIPHFNNDRSNILTSSTYPVSSPMFPNNLSQITESSQTVNGSDQDLGTMVGNNNKRVSSKPKFIVTPAVDPLHSNMS